jgi:hypothetical protein
MRDDIVGEETELLPPCWGKAFVLITLEVGVLQQPEGLDG